MRASSPLSQRVLVALVPLHELGDTVVQAPVGLVAAFRLELSGVRVRLVDIARLHRQEFLLRGLAVGVLDFGNKVHQLHRMAAPDVVHLVRHAVRALVGDRHVVERMHGAFGDVVDVGEVADHVAVVEHLDGLALRNRQRKEHRTHVGAAPRAVNRKVAQTRHRDAVKFRIGMRHQLVTLLAGSIQTNWIIDLVVFAVRLLRVQAINGTGREPTARLHICSPPNINKRGAVVNSPAHFFRPTLPSRASHVAPYTTLQSSLYITGTDLSKTPIPSSNQNMA